MVYLRQNRSGTMMQAKRTHVTRNSAMVKSFRWAWIAGFLIALAPAAPSVQAQEASLNLVPANAPIVVQMNGFDKARNRLGKFLGNALPDLAPKLAKQIDDG